MTQDQNSISMPLLWRPRVSQFLSRHIQKGKAYFLQGIAGCGKTTAIHQFLDQLKPHRPLYLSLQASDNACASFMAHYQETDSADPSLQTIFVIDQFEHITNQEVIDQCCRLIQQNNHITYVFVSNHALPKAFEKLYFYQKLEVLDCQKLFFTREELQQIHISDQIYSQTLGWIGGVLFSEALHPEIPLPILKHKCSEYISECLAGFDAEMRSYLQMLAYYGCYTFELCQTISDQYTTKYFLLLRQSGILQEHQHLIQMIPIIKDDLLAQAPTFTLAPEKIQIIIKWYHDHRFIQELIAILDDDALYQYVKDHFFTVISSLNLKSLKEIRQRMPQKSKEIKYIEGYIALLEKDKSKLRDTIQQLQKYHPAISVDAFLNDPIYRVQQFMKSKDKGFSFYDHSCSYLNGLIDLSDYFHTIRENEMKQNHDNTSLSLAYLEVLHMYGQDTLCLAELEKILPAIQNEQNSEHFAVIGQLLYRVYYALGLKEMAKQYFTQYETLAIASGRQDIISDLQRFKIEHFILENETAAVKDYLKSQNSQSFEFTQLTDMILIARSFLYLKNYEQACFFYSKLVHQLKGSHRTIDYAVCLFGYACALLGSGKKELAYKKSIEAFALINPYRYVAPLTTFGSLGRTLVNAYMDLIPAAPKNKKPYENKLWASNYRIYIESIQKQCYFLCRNFPQENDEERSIEKLTPKEEMVLKYLIEGYPNKEIGEKLHITLPTVKTHVSNIYSKLSVKTRAQAIKRATELKLF